MKSIFKSAGTVFQLSRKSATAFRFSFLDDVLNEEYGDHQPFVSDQAEAGVKAVFSALRDFISRWIFQSVVFFVFVFYLVVFSTLRLVRFIR